MALCRFVEYELKSAAASFESTTSAVATLHYLRDTGSDTPESEWVDTAPNLSVHMPKPSFEMSAAASGLITVGLRPSVQLQLASLFSVSAAVDLVVSADFQAQYPQLASTDTPGTLYGSSTQYTFGNCSVPHVAEIGVGVGAQNFSFQVNLDTSPIGFSYDYQHSWGSDLVPDRVANITAGCLDYLTVTPFVTMPLKSSSLCEYDDLELFALGFAVEISKLLNVPATRFQASLKSQQDGSCKLTLGVSSQQPSPVTADEITHALISWRNDPTRRRLWLRFQSLDQTYSYS